MCWYSTVSDLVIILLIAPFSSFDSSIHFMFHLQPFKWELKNQPGAMSPARGGFRPDDPNQQILADEDIYDEYGGEFLAPHAIQ